MRPAFHFLSNYFWIILGVLCALPFLILAMYAHPLSLHDWDWSVMFSRELESGLSFIEQQSYFFSNTMGRFASTAVSSTLQYWFSPTNFKIFLVLFFILFLSSIHFFISSIFQGFLSRKQRMSIFGGLVCLYFTQLTSPYESFYNISCINTYNLAACIVLIFGGLLIRRFRKPKSILRDFLLIILGIFIVGSNEMTLIAVNWTLLLIIIGKRYYHNTWDKSILLIFIVIISFSLIAVAAPGNYVRMDYEENSQSLFEALIFCIGMSCFNWLRWLSSTPLLMCILLYIPVGLKISDSLSVQKFFNYPLLTGLGILILQPACLFILFYSAGITTFPERIMDLLFLLTLVGSIYFVQSILVQGKQIGFFTNWTGMPPFLTVLFGSFIIVHVCFTGLTIDKSPSAKAQSNKVKLIQTNSNVGNAWLAIFSGEARIYDKGMKQVYEEIERCADEICVVSTPKAFPIFIYDKIYDKKALNGSYYIGEYFHRTKKMKVIYDENPKKDLLLNKLK